MKIKQMGKIPITEDLKSCLKQRRIPIKFCYPDKGGDMWNVLRRDTNYTLGKRELTAFKGGLPEIKKIIGYEPINVVHLGPGDGIEIPILFETFKPNDNRRYAGVDISEQMILNTFRLNKSFFSDTHPLWYLTDIETEENLELVYEDVRKKGANRNLSLLTNQGVLFSNPETLKNIHESMKKQDYLFITIEGDDHDRRKEICTTYDLPKVRELLSIGLERAGYNPQEGQFRTIFNDKESRAEVFFKPKKEEEILCLASYKPREDEFRERLDRAGFDIQFLQFYEDVHTFAVLCTKRRE